MHIKKVIFVFCVCFMLLSCDTRLPSNAEGKNCIKKQNNNYFLISSSLSFTNCCCIFVKYPVYIFTVPLWKVYSKDIFSTWFHVLHETLARFCTLTHWKIKKGKKSCQPVALGAVRCIVHVHLTWGVFPALCADLMEQHKPPTAPQYSKAEETVQETEHAYRNKLWKN